jgi:[ribosomal protein S5]-alanine N-acetyltransferase
MERPCGKLRYRLNTTLPQRPGIAVSLTDRIAALAARLQGLPGFPSIEDGDIRLRPPGEDDIAPLFAVFSHPEVMRYWSRPPMRDEREAAAYIDDMHQVFARREGISWVIADPASDALLGTCTFYDLQPRHLRAGIGYALDPQHWGRGHAARAVRLACAWGFDWLGLHRVEADIHPDNAGSRRVLERCGFRREGLLRERFVTPDEIQHSEIYGLLAGERGSG